MVVFDAFCGGRLGSCGSGWLGTYHRLWWADPQSRSRCNTERNAFSIPAAAFSVATGSFGRVEGNNA